MSRQIDWNNLLLPGMRGLAVEGKTDKTIIEAFLTAGENTGKWSIWRSGGFFTSRVLTGGWMIYFLIPRIAPMI